MIVLKNKECGQTFEVNQNNALPERCPQKRCKKPCHPSWEVVGIVMRLPENLGASSPANRPRSRH